MIQTADLTADKVNELAKNPAALRPDDLPILRFTAEEEVDRIASDKQKRTVYRDVTYVYIRARGDTKNELKELVDGWSVESVTIPVEKERTVQRDVQQPDGSWQREQRTELQVVDEEFFDTKPATPWFDKLEEKRHHGFISNQYVQYCRAAYEAWAQKREQPIDGTPVNGWNQISHAQQKNLIELGYNTIERTATMTEEGMKAFGMGAMDIKKQAINYLKTLPGADSAYELKRLQEENAQLAAKANRADELMTEFEKKMKELEERQEASENKPKGRGRPKKVKDESTDDNSGSNE